MFIILIALSLWQNHASIISDSSVNYAHHDIGETDKKFRLSRGTTNYYYYETSYQSNTYNRELISD